MPIFGLVFLVENMGLNISLSPETLFHLGSFPITNSFFVSIFILSIILIVMLRVSFKFKEVPGHFQNVIEILIEEGFGFVESILGDKEKTKKVFPLVFTLFIFILAANLFSFIPGQSAINLVKENGFSVPVFRSVMADYGMVLVLTMITVITVQIVAIVSYGPLGYVGKFFNFSSPLNFFLGLMDIIGETAKIVSLSFRLFGNIFAGEVLSAVMLFLAPFFIPLPFMFLGLLSAVVQAFVFSVLTLVFIMLASAESSSDQKEKAVA